MPRRFELLVFDWDGTLIDSAGAIVASLQAACRDLGLPVPPDERAQHIIGLGLHDSLSYVLPGLDPGEYPRVAERYGHHFRLRDPDLPMFPGVVPALHALREDGFLLAVATGKSRRGLARALEQTGLAPLFHATRCADEAANKPDPAMLLDLMALLDADPANTLMIGDTTHDLQMALNAGVASAATAWGAHPRAQLVAMQPLVCFDRPPELWQWLGRNA